MILFSPLIIGSRCRSLHTTAINELPPNVGCATFLKIFDAAACSFEDNSLFAIIFVGGVVRVDVPIVSVYSGTSLAKCTVDDSPSEKILGQGCSLRAGKNEAICFEAVKVSCHLVVVVSEKRCR